MSSGALCISIDLELAWGIWDKPSAAYHRSCAEKERAIVAALLDVFAAREIAATWAIVGRLLDGTAKPPVQTDFGDRIWFAPELVDAIRRASPVHDIGSHGFSHLYFPQTDREQLRADLQAARRIHDTHGLDFTSFVFPRNQVAHLDLLAEAGLEVFRGDDVGWHASAHETLGRGPGRAAHLLDGLLPIPPAVVQPRAHRVQLVELQGSMLLLSRAGLRRLVRPEVAALKGKLGLRRAARSGGIFHLWFHPSNFYRDTDVQLRVLEQILDEACSMRDRGELEIRTMASYAARRARSAVQPAESAFRSRRVPRVEPSATGGDRALPGVERPVGAPEGAAAPER